MNEGPEESLSGVTVQLQDGTAAYATAYQKDTLLLRCARAFPPGKPLSLTVQLQKFPETLVSARCIGSKLQPDGHYEVRLRLTNLRRQTREVLAATFTAGQG